MRSQGQNDIRHNEKSIAKIGLCFGYDGLFGMQCGVTKCRDCRYKDLLTFHARLRSSETMLTPATSEQLRLLGSATTGEAKEDTELKIH